MIEGRDFAAAATVGRRQAQEDDWGTHANPPALEAGACLLAAVADGMGGAPAGDRASQTIVRAFLDSYLDLAQPARARLHDAMLRANEAIECAVEAAPELSGMGATLVAALFLPDHCEWLSVGDSLILLCRDGKAERVNPLHIYAAELDAKAQRGEITRQAALAHPDRYQLTSVVMGWPIEQLAAGSLSLQAGDVVLLTSDGLATLSDDEVAAICAERAGRGAQAQWIAEALLRRIEEHQAPRQDNATVVVVLPNSEAASAGSHEALGAQTKQVACGSCRSIDKGT